jgi:hypothetical protein
MTHQTEKLLNDVGFRLAALREARNRFSDQLAPEFRIFDYLRTDEMGLSRCIASLLDPKDKHGQGGIFLEAFLKILGDAADWAIDAEDCEVSIEKQANGQPVRWPSVGCAEARGASIEGTLFTRTMRFTSFSTSYGP